MGASGASASGAWSDKDSAAMAGSGWTNGKGSVHLIGGADVAAELDAKRAIAQGTRAVAAL